MESKNEQMQMMEIARQEVWTKTPVSYAKLGPNLTLFQKDVQFMVSDNLQTYVKTFYDLNLNNTSAKPRALFTKYMLENGIPPFRIYLADMNIDPANYKVVRKAIEEMNMLVDHPELDENGKPTGHIIYSPVFTKFRVPLTGDYYRKRDDHGEVIVESARHSGYIEVEINKDVAQYAFDMSQGYVNHPKLIARYASKQKTPTLYFKLQEMMGKEKRTRVKISVQEIKKALGFEPFKDETTGEWIVPYAKFAHFKTKILDAVKEDLDRMARENHTDITFEYEPVYLNGRKRGDPDYIEFTIMSTDLGIGYSLLTKKDTPATDEEKERRKEAAVQQDLFRDPQQQPYYDAFYKAIGEIRREVTRDKAAKFRKLHFMEYKNQNLYLHVPDNATYQWVEGPQVLSILVAKLRQYFPDFKNLQYWVPE